MGSTAVEQLPEPPQKTAAIPITSARRRSNQSSASTVLTESGDASTTASMVTLSQPSTPAHELSQHDAASLYGSASSLPPESPWMRSVSSATTRPHLVGDIAGSAPSSSSIMAAKKPTTTPASEPVDASDSQPLQDTTESLRDAPSRSRTAIASRSSQSGRNLHSVPHTRGPKSSTTTSAIDRRLIDKYERVNHEIERVIRATTAEVNPENGQLLKQVRSELRKAKKTSSQIIQSQKELLEKMERQEHGALRRIFGLNREHKLEKLRTKLCEKISQSVAADEQLDRLERQSVSLTRMSFGSMCATSIGLEHDELSELEREREDIMASLLSKAGLPDAQELHARLAMYSSEKRACESALKQADQCEALYRKALHLLRVALSTILAPSYSGSLKEFVLGPYPLAVEASQLIEQACRHIQPESRRRYSAYTPELSSVRPPKFPQQMSDFGKRGARSNFDPSNAAAIEAMRKLHVSENVVILLQRIVIAKLELIDKWKREAERELEAAEDGYRKVDHRLQEHLARLARSVSAA